MLSATRATKQCPWVLELILWEATSAVWESWTEVHPRGYPSKTPAQGNGKSPLKTVQARSSLGTISAALGASRYTNTFIGALAVIPPTTAPLFYWSLLSKEQLSETLVQNSFRGGKKSIFTVCLLSTGVSYPNRKCLKYVLNSSVPAEASNLLWFMD